MPPRSRNERPPAARRRPASHACALACLCTCLWGVATAGHAQDSAADPHAAGAADGSATDATDGTSTPAAPSVDEADSDAPPPPVGQEASDTSEPPPGKSAPTTPEPPQSYQLPVPPIGARYPGMDDLRSGSPFTGDDGELHLPIRVSTRLRVLSTDLEALASEGGSSTANGVLSMVTGGLILALGALTEDESFSTFLYVFGTATILRGGVDMIVTPDPSEPALQYSHMPMRNIAEVRQRLSYGEQGLASLADGFRLARILDGSLSLAAGVVIIPLVLAPKDFKFEHTFDVFVVVGAGISILSGIISLLTKSEAERRDAAYRKLRYKLQKPPKAETGTDLAVDFTPTPSGALLRLRGRF